MHDSSTKQVIISTQSKADLTKFSERIALFDESGTALQVHTEEELNSRFVSSVRSRWTVGIGDSMMANADSWWARLCSATGQRMSMLYNAGVGGQTSTQILARIQTDVIDRAPGYCVIGGVTPNDTSVSMALATRKANIVAMVDACLAANIQPILATSCPHDTTATRDELIKMNAWLAGYAELHGYPLLDLYTPLADSADSTYASANTSDGTHPNAIGTEVLVAALTDTITELFPRPPAFLLTPGKADAGNLLANGVFVTDTNADGVADSWDVQGTASAKSLVSMSTDGQGNYQRIESTGALCYANQQVSSGWSVGDVIEFTGKWKTDVASWASVQVLWYGPNTYTTYTLHSSSSVRTFRIKGTVPTGCTAVYVRAVLQASGYLQVGQMTARNLTTLAAS